MDHELRILLSFGALTLDDLANLSGHQYDVLSILVFVTPEV